MWKIVCLAVVIIAGVSAFKLQGSSISHGSSSESDRIFGGQNATVGQFPYQVTLRIDNGTTHQCGGSIIGRRFVLTAAHCTQREASIPENLIVVVGAHRLSTGGTHYRVDRIINHPNFEGSMMANDICVIRTAEQIIYSCLIAPIALPSVDVPVEGNVPASVSGWGGVPNGTWYDEPDVLQWKNTATLNIEICRSRLTPESREKIHSNILCTTNPLLVGACYGDSGGPLVSRTEPKVQLGIVSWGDGKYFDKPPCGKGSPDVYTRVYPHLPFIRVAMQE